MLDDVASELFSVLSQLSDHCMFSRKLIAYNIKKCGNIFLRCKLLNLHIDGIIMHYQTSLTTISSMLMIFTVITQDMLLIERFSFECRNVIGFAVTTLRDWFKKLPPLFHPIRSKTKTNRDSLVRVFPRFASASCNYFAF